MIYLEMYGRLGNQFFRYAVARAVQIKYYPDEPLVINYDQIEKAAKTDPTFYDVLVDFNVHEYKKICGGKPLLKKTGIIQKLICIPYYIGLRRFQPEQMNEIIKYEGKWSSQLNKVGCYWFRQGTWKLEKSKSANKFISGSFEDPVYFDDIKDVLLEELKPNKELLPKNRELYSRILSSNSICLSVRRGDFESDSDIRKLHSVCHKEYFETAIEKMKELVKSPVFFLFSDDIDWVRKNIKNGCETYYEDGTDPVWEKVRLMSACKHFIISNSTFSWWVQYLSSNNDKIVISPSRWFNNDYNSPLIDRKNWVLVEV